MGISKNQLSQGFLHYTDPCDRFSSASLAAVPPFGMQNVTARAFPLQASMTALNAFCDAYLNMDIPPSVVQFRPAIPYVYLLALDYGSMTPEAIKIQNLGWVAQHELLFMVPMQRWREESGRMVFKDFACVSPFIFVDDAMSQRTGREVYGWPKVLGEIDSSVDGWVDNPRAGSRLFSMSAKVFPKTYLGEKVQPRPVVEIDREAPPRWTEIPINTSNPFGVMNDFAKLGRSAFTLGASALDILFALRIHGHRTDRTATNMIDMSKRIAQRLVKLLPDNPLWPINEQIGSETSALDLSISQITLKQFRDVANPTSACYQALVSSQMSVSRLNAGGLLGDSAILRGDLSGGYTVRIHRYQSQPIVEALGIEIESEAEDDNGAKVAIVKPVLPFWTDVDLDYGKGTLLCSRVPARFPRQPVVWRDAQADAQAETAPCQTVDIPYNTARGAATQPVSGPFVFPDMTFQVFPLLADPRKMQACLDRYLNDILHASGFRFEVLGSYAYLIAQLCGDEEGTMWSEVNNIGWWAEREVSFNIPVRWLKDGELQSIALVSPFVFANSGRAVLTDREVNGRATVQATIEAGEDVWFAEPSGPVKPRHLLRVGTEVFPAMNLGQPTEQRTLIQIDENDALPWNDIVGWRLVEEGWGNEVAAEFRRLLDISANYEQEIRDAKALATQFFACGAPVNVINLKQYLDTESEQACYQSIVHTKYQLTDVYDVREIDKRMHVHLHRYPGQPIAETLGLKVKVTRSKEGQVIQSMQPMRPFWMRVAIREELGEELCWRASDSDEWTITHSMFAPPAPTGEQETDLHRRPVFVRPGYTRAVRRLGKPQHLAYPRSQRLDDTVEDELRRALTMDLQALADDEHVLAQYPELQDFDAYAAARTTDALYVAVERMINEFSGIDVTSKRLSHAQAAKTVAALDEPHLVIGCILSEKWCHWGDPQNEKTSPACSIRTDSVDWREERKLWLQRHGLKDEAGWIVLDKSS